MVTTKICICRHCLYCNDMFVSGVWKKVCGIKCCDEYKSEYEIKDLNIIPDWCPKLEENKKV